VRQPYLLPFVESVVTGTSVAIVPEIEAPALVPGRGFFVLAASVGGLFIWEWVAGAMSAVGTKLPCQPTRRMSVIGDERTQRGRGLRAVHDPYATNAIAGHLLSVTNS
jgi:hypothetical protein